MVCKGPPLNVIARYINFLELGFYIPAKLIRYRILYRQKVHYYILFVVKMLCTKRVKIYIDKSVGLSFTYRNRRQKK